MKKRIAMVAALGGLFLAAPASANEPDEAAKQEARDAMTRGRQARDNADLHAALKSFKEADAIMRVPTTGLEVARTQVALGQLLEASSTLERLRDAAPDPDEPEAFSNARQAGKELQLDLDERIPIIRVAAQPASGVTLTLDGKAIDVDAAADGVRLDPGQHTLIAKLGTATQRRVVDVQEASTLDVSFDFGAQSAPKSKASGPGMRTSTIAMYALGGVAVAGVGTGVGLGLWANGRRSELRESCAPDCKVSSVDNLRSTYVVANITAGVGVAAAIAAVTVYFARPDEPERKKTAGAATPGAPRNWVSVAPAVGTAPGLSVAGSF